jgi:hypothetical protein
MTAECDVASAVRGRVIRSGSGVRAATLTRLAALEDRVRAAVAGGQLADPATVDALRGLVVTDQQAMRIASNGPSAPLAGGPLGPLDGSPLEQLAERLGLDTIDLDLLLIAAAPDLDPRYEQLFGYLHDDVTQRRASIGLSLRLTGHELTDVAARRRFAPDSPLRRAGLVDVVDEVRPFLTRPLRVPDRIVTALLDDEQDPLGSGRIAHELMVVVEPMMETTPWITSLAASLEAGISFVHVEDRPELTAVALAASAVVLAKGVAVVVELAEGRDAVAAVEAARREAMLTGGGLVIDHVNVLVDSNVPTLDQLAAAPIPVVVVGRGRWRPEWAEHVPLALVAPPLDEVERDACWTRALGGEFGDAAAITSAFRLGPQRIERAATAARLAARHRGGPLESADIHAGARLQNASGLQRLARRIEPVAGWSDLVVTAQVSAALREVTARVRHRALVLDGWQLRRGGGRGDGLTAMFSGPSGTGKTLAAEVIARELGVDLHTVDLATVVDKYIGETEKNLDRIFDEAEQVNTVLFFDEADALFGKRSEVRDARDRYANVEVAYLLQRMERFDGLAILATNLRLNIDDAFARRLDVTVDFPKPKAAERLRLWVHLIGRRLPLDDTVDLPFLADSFDIAGGSIRNVVVTAAYLAAEAGRDVTMTDFVRGVAREYNKLGLLCLEHEFGAWYASIDASGEAAAV